ncbi:hypothetical protein Ddye_005349 [Dipteronia dyeriana]|uniref:Uncharacterized protein n=1 Tax=Dipteronia dyeriana TaxID=168575 RepID=A0AAD9XFX8_9ROSI|nr:hypothetical protein Ddye_005349 [Dipteronia dyeriana]
MESKNCCGSRSYVPSSCVSTTPKKDTTTPVMIRKKEENVKLEVTTQKKVAEVGVIQTPKTEEKQAVNVKQEEPVQVNV